MALPISPARLAVLVVVVLAPMVAVAATPLSSALGPIVLAVIATAGSVRRGGAGDVADGGILRRRRPPRESCGDHR